MLALFALIALQFEDIPAALRSLVPTDFPAYLKQVEAESARRLRDGEMDHMVHYMLQSTRFTARPSIEPALSARTLHDSKDVPQDVAARAGDFLQSGLKEERFRYLRSIVQSKEEVLREYKRAMEFLYEKEFASKAMQGAARRQYIAGLYQTRGHSSDTSIEANFTVHVGLEVLHQMQPQWRAQRALMIGPGLDFAPRTALREEAPPASYQPYLLLDSLLRLKLAVKPSLMCVDLNPRVVEHLSRSPRQLPVSWKPEDDGQRAWIQGVDTGNLIRPLQARQLNILTARLDTKFDLIVATNVLLYFDAAQLLLAMSNVRAMLNPGGVFLHNDPRQEIESYSRALEMPILTARMIRLSAKRQLYDTLVLHQAN